MTDDAIIGSVSYLIAQVGMRHRTLAARLLSDLGVHPGQEFLLNLLWQEDGRTQAELAALAGVEPATISRTVQRLERAAFVERRPDPVDGRVQRVWLTDAGRALRAGIAAAWARLEAATLCHLDDGERAQLQRLLRRVRRNLLTAIDATDDRPRS